LAWDRARRVARAQVPAVHCGRSIIAGHERRRGEQRSSVDPTAGVCSQRGVLVVRAALGAAELDASAFTGTQRQQSLVLSVVAMAVFAASSRAECRAVLEKEWVEVGGQ